MAAKHSRASTLQQRRLIQIGTAAACIAFVGMALGAVVVDRSVSPAPDPVLPPAAPLSASGDSDGGYPPSPPLIATGLSSVFELDPVTEPTKPVGPGQEDPPPQDIVLVAAIGQPGSMMAVIREGAAQTAIAEGQRAGSVDVLEVKPGWARVRHRGEERELTIGKPTLLVSDMGASDAVPMGSQIIQAPGTSMIETGEERGVTRTRTPTALQRAQSGGNSGGPGGPGDRGGSSGNPGNRGNRGVGNGNGNGNGNGQPVPGGPKQPEDDR